MRPLYLFGLLGSGAVNNPKQAIPKYGNDENTAEYALEKEIKKVIKGPIYPSIPTTGECLHMLGTSLNARNYVLNREPGGFGTLYAQINRVYKRADLYRYIQ